MEVGELFFLAFIGAAVMGLIFNQVVAADIITDSSKFYGLMNTAWWQHLIIGGLAFGAVFMATDPVTASQTNKGKWIYGFLNWIYFYYDSCFQPSISRRSILSHSVNECLCTNNRPLCGTRKCEEKIKTF